MWVIFIARIDTKLALRRLLNLPGCLCESEANFSLAFRVASSIIPGLISFNRVKVYSVCDW